MVRPLDRELIDRQPLVLGGVGPVDQADEIAAGLTVLLVLHRDAADQQLVELAVGREQGRDAEVEHLLEGVFLGGRRDVRVQAMDGFTQAEREQHLKVVGAFRGAAIVGDVRAVEGVVADLGQPAEGFLFWPCIP